MFEGTELIYSDPPYLKRTRSSRRRYRYDYEEADHVELLELLKAVPCQVMVSGYRSALYEERLEGWRSVALQVMNHAGVRTECVWMNFPADRLHWALHRLRGEPRCRWPNDDGGHRGRHKRCDRRARLCAESCIEAGATPRPRAAPTPVAARSAWCQRRSESAREWPE